MNTSSLSASGEAAWQSLRQHIEWTPGFWLGWLFTDHTPSGRELFERTAALLRGLGRRCELRRPAAPEELSDILAWLLAGADDTDGCVAVEVVRISPDWRTAWDNFLLRLNERRELLRKHLRGGLLLIAPTTFKPLTRETAPDLWSIRSLVLDVAPPLARLTIQRQEVRTRSRREPSHIDTSNPNELQLAEQALSAARRAARPEVEAHAGIRLARALLAEGRAGEAREQAARAVELAPTDALGARALETLGDIEERLGDLIAAERHYRTALDRAPDEVSTQALYALASILNLRSAFDEASAIAHLALTRNRAQRTQHGDSVGSLRDEALTLDLLGRILEARGDLAAALDVVQQDLALTQRIRTIVGDTPETLRDQSISLMRGGMLLHIRGDISAAVDLFQQALTIARRVRALTGDTPETLRNEYVALSSVGIALGDQGDLPAARELHQQALVLSRRSRAITGDTPQVLQDESVSLRNLGNIFHAQGDLSTALDLYQQALDLSRRLCTATGTTPQALRSESISLGKIAKIRRAQGDLTAAIELYQEGLALVRRVRAVIGETPQVLRDESIFLGRLGDIFVAQGDLPAALDLYEQDLALVRRARDTTGDTPIALRDEAVSLNNLGNILSAQGNHSTALDYYQQSLALARRVRALTGDTTQALRDEAEVQERIDSLRNSTETPEPSV